MSGRQRLPAGEPRKASQRRNRPPAECGHKDVHEIGAAAEHAVGRIHPNFDHVAPTDQVVDRARLDEGQPDALAARRRVEGHPLGERRSPSGAKNFTTLLREALNEFVIVTDNGGRRKVSKRQAIITQLVNRSAAADFRAIKIQLDILRDLERQTEPNAPETSAFSEADEKVLEQLKARFSKAEK
jgi:hypothetical protein